MQCHLIYEKRSGAAQRRSKIEPYSKYGEKKIYAKPIFIKKRADSLARRNAQIEIDKRKCKHQPNMNKLNRKANKINDLHVHKTHEQHNGVVFFI